ncbi:MAG: M20/M25/M40 family metallo-hydrolase [Armatimonadetes bacterium]|nr:M20/M25/M40 family metallo-hydrolase [Armatimonadota bacterium]
MIKFNLLNSFLELIKIEGLPKREKKVARYVKNKLKSWNYSFKEDKASLIIQGDSNNIIVFVKGEKSAPGLLFLSHLDTVSSTKGINCQIKDGIISSKNNTILGADDRAGAAVMLDVLYKLPSLKKNHQNLVFIFTVAEEIGLLGAKCLNLKEFKGGWGFVLDTSLPVGSIVNASPSLEKIKITFLGASAHSGICPELGKNALKMAALTLSNLPLGRIDLETTANIGKIYGGEACNIIPAEIVLEGEIRSHSLKKLKQKVKEFKAIAEKSANIYGGEAEFISERDFLNFNLPKNHPLVQYTLKAVKRSKFLAKIFKAGGGSDANILNQTGIPSIVLGVGFKEPHSKKESIKVEDLNNLSKVIFNIIQG